MMPRKAAAESFGKRTTLPSGCTKNLTRWADVPQPYSNYVHVNALFKQVNGRGMAECNTTAALKNLKPEVYGKRSPLVQRLKLSAVMQCYGIASTFRILK